MRKNLIALTVFAILVFIAGCARNSAPKATVLSPAEGSTYNAGDAIQFTGSARDKENGALSGGSLVWVSSLDGPIGTGESFASSALSPGAHLITLSATDRKGRVSRHSVTIVIHSDSAPTAQIVSPAGGSGYIEGEAIAFAGSAYDEEDGSLSNGSLVWVSSRDGPIGTGGSFTSNALSPGAHQITLMATDSKGGVGAAAVAIVVNANALPVAQIAGPAGGGTFYEWVEIQFAGSASDEEDGALTGMSLAWRSSIDGPIGTGETFALDTLSTGIHQISLAATDSKGAVGTDSVTITINAVIPTAILPDTGQNAGYTGTFGEDADYTINPPSYTKLDSSGNVLDAGAADWAMVRDNVTGLIWEGKTDDGGIHDKDYTCNWADAQSSFLAQLNSAAFGGFSDWRLPTIKELGFLLDAGVTSPMINPAYYPNTMPSYYWSGTTYYCNAATAWVVEFHRGILINFAKTNLYSVRAVRGGG